MTVNPNGEAEVLKVYFKPRPRLKKVIVDLDFSTLAIKGRSEPGQPFFALRHPQDRDEGARHVDARQPGNLVRPTTCTGSTPEGRGYALGAFKGEDKLPGMDAPHLLYHGLRPATALSRRYGAGRTLPSRAGLCGLLFRPRAELLLSENASRSNRATRRSSSSTRRERAISSAARDVPERSWKMTYAGAQASRPAERIEVDGFVGVKSHRAKGKRVTTFEVASLHFVEPEEPEEGAGRSCDGR